MVQHRATRFDKSVPHRHTKPPTSASAMISDLGWEPLQTRRLHGRLNMFFKITRGMAELPLEYHPVSQHQPATWGHSQQFQRLQPSVDAYKYAYFPRTIQYYCHHQITSISATNHIVSNNIVSKIHFAYYIKPWLDHMWNMPILFGVHIKMWYYWYWEGSKKSH